MTDYDPPAEKTKTWCNCCGNGFGDEEFMLGRCCGMPLVEVPWTDADYAKERGREKARKQLLDLAAKLGW